MKLFVVFSRENDYYTEKQIEGIFTTKIAADEFIAKHATYDQRKETFVARFGTSEYWWFIETHELRT